MGSYGLTQRGRIKEAPMSHSYIADKVAPDAVDLLIFDDQGPASVPSSANSNSMHALNADLLDLGPCPAANVASSVPTCAGSDLLGLGPDPLALSCAPISGTALDSCDTFDPM